MVNFRNTLYVTDKSTARTYLSSGCVLGRPLISKSLFQSDMAASIIVMDRLGSLSVSFASVVTTAKGGTPVSFGFSHYSNGNKFAIRFVADPRIALSLTLLSNSFTLRQLHDANVQFTATHFSNDLANKDETILIELFLDMLRYFEKLNVITLWSKIGCINRVAATSEMDSKPKSFISGKVEATVSTKHSEASKVGGLNVGYKQQKNRHNPYDSEVHENPIPSNRIEKNAEVPESNILQLGGLKLDMSGPTEHIFIDMTEETPKVSRSTEPFQSLFTNRQQ